MERLRRSGVSVRIWTMPSEIPNAIPFDLDYGAAEYDAVWAERFFQTLQQADRVLKNFRTPFTGKVSPVHFFWGGFDLAVTRFSGRTAPPPPGETPNVAKWVMAEAYSHEVSSCGFWPGNGGYGKAAFYAYAYPEPAGFADRPVRPKGARYHTALRQFVLPYDVVRTAADPDAALLDFCQSTYENAADLGRWDRAALEPS